MKNLLLSCALIALFIGAKAQTKDVITLKTGKVVDCNITVIDTANQSLTCTNDKGDLIGVVPFSKIESYNVNGENYYLDQEIKYSDLATSSRGVFSSYVASDGAVYKIGDRIKIGVPSSNKTFAFITFGDGLLVPITNLTADYSGEETEIKKIFVVGTKRSGYSVSFRTKGFTGISPNYTIRFENALSTGEVKGFGKTSDEALSELKKAKDKLDLGLITQEEFDNLKAELRKYIK